MEYFSFTFQICTNIECNFILVYQYLSNKHLFVICFILIGKIKKFIIRLSDLLFIYEIILFGNHSRNLIHVFNIYLYFLMNTYKIDLLNKE